MIETKDDHWTMWGLYWYRPYTGNWRVFRELAFGREAWVAR